MDRSKFKFIRSERIIESVFAHSLEEQLQTFLFENNITSEEELDALDEATLSTLRQNIERGFPRTKKRQHITNQVTIIQKTLTPYVGSRNLLVKSQAKSQTSGPNIYTPEILFDSVVYEDEDSPNNITFTATDGNQYHIQPIKYTGHNARVTCTCLDFHYRFAYYNSLKGDLSGKAPGTKPGLKKKLWGKVKDFFGSKKPKEEPQQQQQNQQQQQQQQQDTEQQQRDQEAKETILLYPKGMLLKEDVNPMRVPGFCKHLIRLHEDLQKDNIITFN